MTPYNIAANESKRNRTLSCTHQENNSSFRVVCYGWPNSLFNVKLSTSDNFPNSIYQPTWTLKGLALLYSSHAPLEHFPYNQYNYSQH